MEDLAKLINEINSDQDGMNAAFPKMIHKDEIDLSGFSEQKSSYENIESEYIDQSGDCDYGFYGVLAVPFGDFYIVFKYWE